MKMIFKHITQMCKNAKGCNKYNILRLTPSAINQVHRFYSQFPLRIQKPRQSIGFYSYEKCNQIRCASINVDSTISENISSKYRELEANFKWRADPVITTLDPKKLESVLQGEEMLELIELFKKNGYELRIAGGAVRDLLMNVVPADVDFATTATPKQMVKMFWKQNIRTINAHGEKFGTVTALFPNDVRFQVTSLRIDVHTDGRYADVEFTTDWLLDAHRRDFTVNSMFLGFDGKVYDYLFGYEDLKNRRIVFIGEPDKRIKEDYLRIMRYFRFYGRVSDSPNNFDANIIKAICENIDGLQDISGPRIWCELRKTLIGKHCFDIFAKIIECGASQYIGLPASVNCENLLRLKKTFETTFKDVAIHPTTIVSTALSSKDDAIHLNTRFKPTAFDRDLAIFLAENKTKTGDIDDLFHYQKLCIPQNKRSSKISKEYTLELLKYNDKRQIYDQLLEWEMPEFPINKPILSKRGYKGTVAELILDKLCVAWADGKFQLSKDELLEQHLTTIAAKAIEELEAEKKSKKNRKKFTARL
ncbi:CCA tRNA nucleotidyltransferase 1, mitochondrial-like [Contarinia nasturtii]|uniref:CCA tRNA nucleotidyltransferase 1, mitochondrial-like n=1 Tax=Contarinia nasturtii TaxID=265458 RepID=UPI0012D475D7|nr:CCA tRNA nucleotidyltransferase 1, mitochondrial-like [Contarinia nasturtii]